MVEKYVNREIPQIPQTVDILNIEEQLGEDIFARELVTRTFDSYAAARSTVEARWTASDSLFNGAVPSRMWKGTNVPRAAYPQTVVSDQFRTIIPALEQAIFPDSGDNFNISPSGTSPLPPQFGRMLTKTLKTWLEESPKLGLPSGRREIMNSLMDAALYKLGCVHLRFEGSLKRPVIEAVNIKDIYVDPKAPSPSAEDNKSIIWRKTMTVRAIKALREQPDFIKIDDDILYGLANGVQSTSGVQNQTVAAHLQKAPVDFAYVYEPGLEDQELEVLIYYSERRVVWVINRTVVFYNKENIYGFFPFCFTTLYPLPHRNYGESLGDLLESTQRLSEGLVNNSLDQIHLATMPPKIERQLGQLGAKDAWYPGLTIKAQDPKNDVVIHDVPLGHITPMWDMVQWLQGQGYSRTGQNPLQQGGTPVASNANRTASGMNIQMQGGSNRLYAIVKTFEDYMLIPLLKKMVEMVRIHIGLEEEVEAFFEGGKLAVPGAYFHAPLKIEVLCASRVISKAALKETLPGLLQYLTAGPFVQQLHQIGQTVDISEIMQALMDASGMGQSYTFVRPLSKEEVSQMQQQAQPKPDPNMVAKIQMESQAERQLAQLKGQIDLEKEKIKQQPNTWEMQAAQMKVQMDMAMKQKDLEIKQFKLELDKQKGQIDLLLKQADIRLKGQEAQMDLEISRQKAVTEARNAEQAAMIQNAAAAVSSEQKLRQSEESHQQKLRLAESQKKEVKTDE